MDAVVLMLVVTGCYTITSLNDKYAASKAKFNGSEFTFLMCGAMSVFMAFTLPFQELYFVPVWQSFAAVILVAACKLIEFQTCTMVLTQLSAFELKAWLGITLFVSYFTDVFFGAEFCAVKLIFITAAAVGLVMIARSGGDRKIEYKKIILPLILYLSVKYGYGLIIKAFTPYASSSVQLFSALVIVTLIVLPKAKPIQLFKKNTKGALSVIIARIPNTVGMIIENMVIAISLASYSFIQPLILVSLFIVGLIRRERYSKLNMLGSVICVVGVLGFQVV
ncbi:MAG: hypothetical protein J1E39_05355 [Eubacterium sp.]|nr:hypothetical protein [Eubacterium sp.]